jgi:hypothetical protein
MNLLVRVLKLIWLPIILQGTWGCSTPSENYVEVRGVVRVNGKPLTDGKVAYVPEISKGTSFEQISIGIINEEGVYTIQTLQQQGMRPGWYRVCVWSAEGGIPTSPYGNVKWKVDEKYTNKLTTPLMVEVVDIPEPGRYDLNIPPPQSQPKKETALTPEGPPHPQPGN